MALFQFSFLTGCAAANASRPHKMKNFMALAGDISFVKFLEENSRYTCSWIMNKDDRSTTTDANGLGSTVFIRRPIVELQRTLKSRVSAFPNTPPLPSRRGFSFRSVWSSIIEASLQIMPRLPNEGG